MSNWIEHLMNLMNMMGFLNLLGPGTLNWFRLDFCDLIHSKFEGTISASYCFKRVPSLKFKLNFRFYKCLEVTSLEIACCSQEILHLCLYSWNSVHHCLESCRNCLDLFFWGFQLFYLCHIEILRNFWIEQLPFFRMTLLYL